MGSVLRIIGLIYVRSDSLSVYKFALRILYGILVQFLAKKANVQGIGTFLYLMLTLTGGFVVIPMAIPPWFKWVTYINPMVRFVILCCREKRRLST